MFHTINPSVLRQINELQKAPEKDKELIKAEKKVIGEGLSNTNI